MIKKWILAGSLSFLVAACGGHETGSGTDTTSTDNLPCDTSALRIALYSDPLFLEAMDPDNPFYTFMRETDSLSFERLNDEFLAIYEGGAMNLEPCSPDYLAAFGGSPDVATFARILCEQMDLNQAIKDKDPCIMELNEKDRSAVLQL